MTSTLSAAPPLALPRRDLKSSLARLAAYMVMALILAWAWNGAEMKPGELVRNWHNIVVLASDFYPPNFHDWLFYLEEMLVTVQIAIWGTVLAIVCAVPCSLLSSANIAPWWVHQPMRRLMDALRSINEIVWAMLFVVAVGLGPFAGTLALFVHTTGIFAKLFSEAVEACDPQPVEGIRATGAGVLDEIAYGVIPQVMPLWISYALYRFESNVRSATVLGIVGAGGIGVVIWEAIRGFQYAQTGAVMIIIVISVTVIDLLSAQLRKLFI
jgi:phosphonate transport system permease protein